jgi:hypothetical protein
MVPPEYLNLPMLVVYLCNPPQTDFTQVTKLAVQIMDKVEEYEHLKSHNIPCLPIDNFEWGMDLDPNIYGDWVVLKPKNIQSSGKDVNMVPTKLIPKLKLSDFPEEHLIRQDNYLVQKFINTGEKPTHYRFLVFLDEVIYSVINISNQILPEINSDLQMLLSSTVASNISDRFIDSHKEDELKLLALQAAKAFPNAPLFGFDIIRDSSNDQLYLLEANVGGNTWHFSSKMSKERGLTPLIRKKMILQYNAWDRAAEALVRKTHELAT